MSHPKSQQHKTVQVREPRGGYGLKELHPYSSLGTITESSGKITGTLLNNVAVILSSIYGSQLNIGALKRILNYTRRIQDPQWSLHIEYLSPGSRLDAHISGSMEDGDAVVRIQPSHPDEVVCRLLTKHVTRGGRKSHTLQVTYTYMYHSVSYDRR